MFVFRICYIKSRVILIMNNIQLQASISPITTATVSNNNSSKYKPASLIIDRLDIENVSNIDTKNGSFNATVSAVLKYPLAISGKDTREFKQSGHGSFSDPLHAVNLLFENAEQIKMEPFAPGKTNNYSTEYDIL